MDNKKSDSAPIPAVQVEPGACVHGVSRYGICDLCDSPVPASLNINACALAAPVQAAPTEPIKRCSVCGDPVRYGSRHHGCAPQSTQAQKPVAWMRHVRRHGEPVQCPKAAAGAFPVYVGDGGTGE